MWVIQYRKENDLKKDVCFKGCYRLRYRTIKKENLSIIKRDVAIRWTIQLFSLHNHLKRDMIGLIGQLPNFSLRRKG